MLRKISVLYLSQIYKVAFPLFLLPSLIHLLGNENYGLVSFFIMLLTLIGLLDAGVSGTFIKLVATNKNNLTAFKGVFQIFLKILSCFFLVACVVVILFIYFANLIALKWLQTSIPINEVVICIQIMGLILALIYLKSYLQSFVNGMERQDLIALWGMVYTTVFYGGSFLVLKYYSNTLHAFFISLACLAIVDILVILGLLYYVVQSNYYCLKKKGGEELLSEMEGKFSLKEILKFSLQLSGLSTIWVIASQADKISLSTYIDLASYGHYQIASQISAIILTLTAPISQFLLPRLSALYKEKKNSEFINIFNYSSLIYILLLVPLMPYMFIYGDELLSIWLRNAKLGVYVNNYAKWLVSAAFMAGLMNFLFILLYSKSSLKSHFIAYALYSLFTIPLSFISAKYFGAHFTSIFVFIHTSIFCAVWGGYCMGKILPGYLSLVIWVFTLVISVSIITFRITFSTQLFSNYPFINVCYPPVLNLILCLILILPFRKIFFEKMKLVTFI